MTPLLDRMRRSTFMNSNRLQSSLVTAANDARSHDIPDVAFAGWMKPNGLNSIVQDSHGFFFNDENERRASVQRRTMVHRGPERTRAWTGRSPFSSSSRSKMCALVVRFIVIRMTHGEERCVLGRTTLRWCDVIWNLFLCSLYYVLIVRGDAALGLTKALRFVSEVAGCLFSFLGGTMVGGFLFSSSRIRL
jgi:hypothetical protein